MSLDAVRAVLAGVVPPFTVALFVLLPRLRPLRAGAPRLLGPLAALAIGLGLLATGLAVLGGLDGIGQPTSTAQKLPWIGAVAALFGAADARIRPRILARAALRAFGAAAALWWLLAFLRARAWSTGEALAWTAALAIAVAAFAFALDALAARRPGPAIPAAYAAALGVAGAALALTGDSAAAGQLAGGLASAVAAVFVVALVRRELVAVDAGFPIALGLAALLCAGRFTGELRVDVALACAAGLLAPALALLLPLARRPLAAFVACVLLAALPGAIAIALAYEPAGDAYSYY